MGWESILETAIGVGGSLLGGSMSSAAMLEANQQNIAFARENRAWQEMMSNTAHQRETKDLIAAGLNPILSATGGRGATTPTGAQATIQAAPHMGEAVQQASRMLAMDIPKLQADIQLAQAHSAKADADRRNVDADTVLKLQESGRSDDRTKALLAGIKQTEQATATSSAQEVQLRTQTQRTEQEVAILKTITPFITEGGTAIRQIIDHLKTGGPIGDAAADLVQSVKRKMAEYEDKLGAFQTKVDNIPRYIYDLVKKHASSLLERLNSTNDATPTFDPDKQRGRSIQ